MESRRARPPEGAIGVWIGPDAFYLDGDSVRLVIFAETGLTAPSEPDHCYRLRTKWDDDYLYYLCPYSKRWEKVATFWDGAFSKYQRVHWIGSPSSYTS